MVVGSLSNNKTGDGVTGLAIYNNWGDFLSAHPMPTNNGGDGYGYDVAINPEKNVILTSSFTGWKNYTSLLAQVVFSKFGNTMVMWNLKSMRPEQIFAVPTSR
jgi:methanethiol oxidase